FRIKGNLLKHSIFSLINTKMLQNRFAQRYSRCRAFKFTKKIIAGCLAHLIYTSGLPLILYCIKNIRAKLANRPRLSAKSAIDYMINVGKSNIAIQSE